MGFHDCFLLLLLTAALLRVSFVFCKESVPLESHVLAVAGLEAVLPCESDLRQGPESPSLVLWYREQERAPFYTLDFRTGTRDKPKRFRAPGYEDRAYFDVGRSPPTLRLHSVSTTDEGLYRCNVEFVRLRSKTRAVRLKVLTPPHSIVITDDSGHELKGVAGPYDEGAYLSLHCDAEGGDPPPSVTWWKDQELKDKSFHRSVDDVVRNELEIRVLNRSHHMTEFRCEASNTNLTRPLSRSVKLDLNLKPMRAKITTALRPLTPGENLRLHCETWGSRPPAKISWWADTRRVQTGKESIPNNKNITYSTLAMRPGVEDNGKTVYCKAEHSTRPEWTVQDSWHLNVLFPPEVSLQLGANIKYSTIKEGNDVYMECLILSNPAISELTWLFEGKPFLSNASAGVIISNQSLVLQKVKREHRGRYRCIAINSEGEGESSDLLLEVRYAPLCRPNQRDLYGVARDETVNVTCDYEADPKDLIFRWTLNNSIEQASLQGHRSTFSHSVLSYTPKSATDYGVLQCWAKNSVGDSREPCIVRIIPAGPPDPVRNCLIVNQSSFWIQVECEAGYSNGLQQRFHLDVYNSAVDHLQVNLTSRESPTFSVFDLPSGTPYVLVVYASNEKGKSNSLAIVAHTLQRQPGEAGSALMTRLSPLVAVLLSVLGTFLMIGVIGLGLVQLRRKRTPKQSIEEDKTKIDIILKKTADEIAETTIACPDVVPPNNALYASPDGETICQIVKDPAHGKLKDNYRNCVVALKRSWSFKKGHQEKVEVDMMLSGLSDVMSDPMDVSSTSLLGDVTLEECFPSKKIVIKVEPPPDPGKMYHNSKV